MSALPTYIRHQLVLLSRSVIDFDAEMADSAFNIRMTHTDL